MNKGRWKSPDELGLRGAKLILQMGFRKDWSLDLHYWIDLYSSRTTFQKSGSHFLYFVQRQWSWRPKNSSELIEGTKSSPPFAELHDALKCFRKHVLERRNRQDILCFYDTRGRKDLENFVLTTRELTKFKADKDHPLPESPKTKTTAELFKESQQLREKNAKW